MACVSCSRHAAGCWNGVGMHGNAGSVMIGSAAWSLCFREMGPFVAASRGVVLPVL